jgi:hypothetical protein
MKAGSSTLYRLAQQALSARIASSLPPSRRSRRRFVSNSASNAELPRIGSEFVDCEPDGLRTDGVKAQLGAMTDMCYFNANSGNDRSVHGGCTSDR